MTVGSFSIFKKNLDLKIQINICQCVQNLSPKIVNKLLDLYQFSKNDLKSACIHALKNEYNDNAFIIIEQNKSLFKEM